MIRSEPTYHPQVPAMSDEGEVKLSIPEPCSQSWSDMRGGTRTRFCESCQHHVHDLSALTQREARALLERSATEALCIRYEVDEDGLLLLSEEPGEHPRMSRQLEGLRRLAAASLVAAPLLLAACEPLPEQTAEAQAPLIIRDGQPVTLSPGAAAPPAAPLTPEEQELERWRAELRAKQVERDLWRAVLDAKLHRRTAAERALVPPRPPQPYHPSGILMGRIARSDIKKKPRKIPPGIVISTGEQ